MDLPNWLNLANGKFLTGLFLFARFGGVLFSAPLLNNRSVPNPVRLGLSGLMALLLTPLVPVSVVDTPALAVAGLVKEVLLGLILGWTVGLVFAAAQMAGEWLDLQAGFQAGSVLNPAFDTMSAPLGNFKHLLAGLVFILSGGYAMVLRGAASSIAFSPPGALSLGMGTETYWAELMLKGLWIAVQLAAPIASALFLAEIGIALANRSLPQVNAMILTLPLKALMAVSMLALSVPVLARALSVVFSDLGADITRLLRMMGAS